MDDKKDRLGAPAAAGNAAFKWDRFGSDSYSDHNYGTRRADDTKLLRLTVAWFRRMSISHGTQLHGVDVGAGPNLYPALAMLPFCEAITLVEYSKSNVRWLRKQVKDLSSQWEPFWEIVSPEGSLGDFASAREKLARVATVRRGSIFDLPTDAWEIGTMFFCAESLTEKREECDEATRRFVNALQPGAPFCAAYMRNSKGYDVAGRRYPATQVIEADIDFALRSIPDYMRTHVVDIDPEPVHAGYDGYLLTVGRKYRP